MCAGTTDAERSACAADHGRYWDEAGCACLCRLEEEKRECSTGYAFDQATCRWVS